MKLTTKLISVLVLVLLASPVVLLKGCGKTVNGGACGGCPDTTAPTGSTAKASAPAAATVSPNGSACWPSTVFTFTGPDGIPLNNICVELTTNGLIAVHNQGIDCYAHALTDWNTYVRTRTDTGGTVTVDLLLSSPCSGVGSGTASESIWAEAVSCSVSALATATVTISPACP